MTHTYHVGVSLADDDDDELDLYVCCVYKEEHSHDGYDDDGIRSPAV